MTALCPVISMARELRQAEAPDTPGAPSTPWWHGTFNEEIQLVAADRTWGNGEPDENLRGLRLTYRMWQDQYDDMLGISSGGYYLGMKRGDDQEVVDAGAELIFFNFALGPVRLGPRLRIGGEYRDEAPGQGLGAVVSGGFQVACWLTKHVQVAALAEREAGSHSGTRDQFGVSIGVAVGRSSL